VAEGEPEASSTYADSADLTFVRGDEWFALGSRVGEDIVMNLPLPDGHEDPRRHGLKADLPDFKLAPALSRTITEYHPSGCDLSSIKGSGGAAIVDTAIQRST